jgi:hypothetical protein
MELPHTIIESSDVLTSTPAFSESKRQDDTIAIPLSSANVTAGESFISDLISGNPDNLRIGSTWLLADNVPGFWSASFGFGFQPSVLRLRNVVQEGRGAKNWRFTALPDGGIVKFTYFNAASGDRVFCDARCPLPQKNPTQQYFYFCQFNPHEGVSGLYFGLVWSGWRAQRDWVRGEDVVVNHQCTA